MHAWRERKWHDGRTKAWLIDMGWPHHHDSPSEQKRVQIAIGYVLHFAIGQKGIWNERWFEKPVPILGRGRRVFEIF